MKRREMREHVFKILFQLDFHPRVEAMEKVEMYFENLGPIEEENEIFMRNIINGVIDNVERIDEVINENAKGGWKTTRMANTDLTITRVSVYEMMFTEDTPESISINEAVEIAKKFSSDEAPSFINALLGDIAKSI